MTSSTNGHSTLLQLDNPSDGLKATRKIFSSTIDGEETIYTWEGKVYSHIQDELDRHLFNIEGMNIRTTLSHHDDEKGLGFRMFSKEVMLFLDPVSNQILREWTNPWTGETVKVFHVANDPANSRPLYPRPNGFEGKVRNGNVLVSYQIPLLYANPLIEIPEGNQHSHYHALEMFDFFLSEEDLIDAQSPRVKEISIAWNRISQWEPWMKMGAKPGQLVFDASGLRVNSWQELSKMLREEIEEKFPNCKTAPPLNDTRPNQTNWSNYKSWLARSNSKS